MSESRAVAFGELGSGLWGVAWSPTAAGPVKMAVGAGPKAGVLTATLAGAGEADEWRLDGEGIELRLSPALRASTSCAARAAG
jgi:hypothetical protein